MKYFNSRSNLDYSVLFARKSLARTIAGIWLKVCHALIKIVVPDEVARKKDGMLTMMESDIRT